MVVSGCFEVALTTAPAASLEALTAELLRQPAERQAIEYKGQWITWGQLSALAERIARLVEASGSAPVALLPRTRPSAVAALLALFAGGRTVQMIHVYQKPAGILRDLDRLKPAALVADAGDLSEELLAGLRERGIVAIVLEGMEATAQEGGQGSWSGDPTSSRELLILSSGTTGKPKHIPIGYDSIVRNLIGQGATGSPESDEEPPKYMCAPLGNISGLMGVTSSIMQGCRMVAVDRFTVEDWVGYVRRYRPRVMGLLAAGIKMIFDADVSPDDLASVDYIPTGAAPVAPEIHRAFEERYGCAILLSYGATEFIGTVCAMTPDLHARWGQEKFGSVGRALPGVSLRVVDPDSGSERLPGTEGILEVMASRVGDAWFRTSDLVVIDADGFMFHRGRADGAINRGGFKVLPETIEAALQSHPAISDASVVAVADARLGEVPAAAVVLRSGAAAPTAPEMQDFLRDRLLATHIPVQWRIVGSLPRTSSLKVARSAVRALFEASD
jgi:acyl-CoA synthetase (AMP-forming)/AMP-acid ligase II